MRYLGCKTSLLDAICEVLQKQKLLRNGLVFFDAFCGTGSVSNHFKNIFRIVLNDNLQCATTFAQGCIVAEHCHFSRLGFDPIDHFNHADGMAKGFFYHNYAPTSSGRMYFTDDNAQRIDFIRQQIEQWKGRGEISPDEYCYLLAALLEGVSHVANVAGVYGAFLKTWDPRALKPLRMMPPVPIHPINYRLPTDIIAVYNSNVEDLADQVDCDILYLDPPYTKNTYATQYHLLETLVRNDHPALRGITGARPANKRLNLWSNAHYAEIMLEKVVSHTRAKHILMSYSSDGLMSKEYILNVLKRHCKAETVAVHAIAYKKYTNSRSKSGAEHYEYLFYGEKKSAHDVVYTCPLNYMGGKSNVIERLLPHLTDRHYFLDLFGGGFNVGINVNGFRQVYYNDTNFKVSALLQMFRQADTQELITFIEKMIKKYALSKNNRDAYLHFRNDWNTTLRKKDRAEWYLYVLILYGFQQQIRFNSAYEFNNPVGESGYSETVKEKIISFSRRLKEIDPAFYIGDFEATEALISAQTLIYADPPYLITLGSYNDGRRGFNGWTAHDEARLLSFLDRMLKRGAKVVLSNITTYKGKTNAMLIDWINKHHAQVVPIEVRRRKEALIIVDKKGEQEA